MYIMVQLGNGVLQRGGVEQVTWKLLHSLHRSPLASQFNLTFAQQVLHITERSGNRTYIITASWMTSGLVLK